MTNHYSWIRNINFLYCHNQIGYIFSQLVINYVFQIMSFPLKPCDIYNNIAETKVKKIKQILLIWKLSYEIHLHTWNLYRNNSGSNLLMFRCADFIHPTRIISKNKIPKFLQIPKRCMHMNPKNQCSHSFP